MRRASTAMVGGMCAQHHSPAPIRRCVVAHEMCGGVRADGMQPALPMSSRPTSNNHRRTSTRPGLRGVPEAGALVEARTAGNRKFTNTPAKALGTWRANRTMSNREAPMQVRCARPRRPMVAGGTRNACNTHTTVRGHRPHAIIACRPYHQLVRPATNWVQGHGSVV